MRKSKKEGWKPYTKEEERAIARVLFLFDDDERCTYKKMAQILHLDGVCLDRSISALMYQLHCRRPRDDFFCAGDALRELRRLENLWYYRDIYAQEEGVL